MSTSARSLRQEMSTAKVVVGLAVVVVVAVAVAVVVNTSACCLQVAAL